MAPDDGPRRTLLALVCILLASVLVALVALGTCDPETPAPPPGAGAGTVGPGGGGAGGGGAAGGMTPDPRLPRDPRPRAGAGEGAADAVRRFIVIVSEAVESAPVTQPIRGARVEIRDAAGAVREAETDAAGRCELDAVPAEGVALRASAPGFVTSAWEEPRGTAAAIVLERAVELEGIVRDRSAAPVAGASVSAVGAVPIAGGGRFGDLHFAPLVLEDGVLHGTAFTGADGRFRVGGLPPSRPLSLRARAADLGPATVQATTPDGGERGPEVEIVLEATGAVEGTVLDPDGAPATGAIVCVAAEADERTVSALAHGSLPSRGMAVAGVLASRTGADGRFRVAGLELGRSYVAVASREPLAPSAPARGIEATAGRRNVSADLSLRRRATLRVRVLLPDGAPAPESWAWVAGGSTGFHDPAAVGSHLLAGVVPGATVLTAGAAGYPPEVRRVDVAEGGDEELVVRLTPGIAWDVQVTAPGGGAVEGATVRAWHEEGGYVDSTAEATTDAEGTARLSALRPGPHVLEALAPGYARTRATGGAGVGAAAGQVVLRRGGIVRGVARDRRGRPLSTGIIEARGPVEEWGSVRGDGGFDLRLPPGRFELRVFGASRSVSVEVVEDAALDLVLTAD